MNVMRQSITAYFHPSFMAIGYNYVRTIKVNCALLKSWIEKAILMYKARWIPSKSVLVICGEYDKVLGCHLWQDCKINVVTIKNAGHFPWIENMAAVKYEIEKFAKHIT